MTGDRLILVVDDDEGIRQLFRMVLGTYGHEVETASNGAAALEIVAHSPPSLVFLDLWMPVMDGWAFAREYRRIARPPAPIVVVSADRDLPKHAKEIEAEAFLQKPFDLDELLEVIEGFPGIEVPGRS